MRELVVYTSPGCVPCAALKPLLVQLQELFQFPMRVIEASAKTQAVFRQMEIRTAPTVLCLDGETRVGMFVGYKSLEELHRQLTTWGILEKPACTS